MGVSKNVIQCNTSITFSRHRGFGLASLADVEANKKGRRIPVSLRLPAAVVDAVEEYARKHDMRKTDAYLRFLRRGIEEDGLAGETADLGRIEAKLDAVLEMFGFGQSIPGDLDIGQVRSAVSLAAAAFPAIERAYLFGSFARGTQSPESDIDVRIELDRSLPFNLHDLSHFMKHVEQLTGREVDVVSATHIKNMALAEAIERERVLVYERAQ